MSSRFATRFPKFAAQLESGRGVPVENVLPSTTDDEIRIIEDRLGIPLPDSYKDFLRSSRGLWLMGGVVQMSGTHPFFHDFPKLETLTQQQRDVITTKGGGWPPPSQACYALLSSL